MIAKINAAGKGFRGLFRYQEQKCKEGVGERIYQNIPGDNAEELTGEVKKIRQQNQRVKKPVFHCSLSLPPGENLPNDKFREVGLKFMNRLGYDNNQLVMYRNYDEPHEHIHIVANRINNELKKTNDSWEKRRGEQIVRELEKEFKLRQVKSSRESKRAALTQGQLRQMERTKRNGEKPELPEKRKLQHIIVRSADKLNRKPSTELFVRRLERRGVQIRFNGKNRINGVSFQKNGVAVKGSDLGRGFSWNKIQQFLNTDEQRDRQLLEKLNNEGGIYFEVDKTDRRLFAAIDKRDFKLMEQATREGADFSKLTAEEYQQFDQKLKEQINYCARNQHRWIGDKEFRFYEQDNVQEFNRDVLKGLQAGGAPDKDEKKKRKRRKGRSKGRSL